jgi:hypothetical protein
MSTEASRRAHVESLLTVCTSQTRIFKATIDEKRVKLTVSLTLSAVAMLLALCLYPQRLATIRSP